ncbi:hypothetical protein POL68_11810 [Stigmatella sp. ncwal1]|uniref:Lipoprotein n=1 Tax=Stigmatella ashevillensis TaxID=2995309 RepID=A0ABT5D666_9BACT|nr:hypothetical protein [Stigmatella ashevillena]MDC0709150.1 hypothetical protein [Stigmatella ashevillena]
MRALVFVSILGCGIGLLTACGADIDEDFFEEPTPVCSKTCQGCCSGETCFDGNQQTSCGSNGSKCAVCKGTTSCRGNAEKEMSCVFAAEALWRVQPVSAKIASQTPAGFDWDLGGSPPDVVAEVICPPSASPISIKTAEIESFTPQWTDSNVNCTTTSDALLAEPISIKLIDVDFDFNDDIASASYKLVQQDFENGRVEILLSDQKSTLTLQFFRLQ